MFVQLLGLVAFSFAAPALDGLIFCTLEVLRTLFTGIEVLFIIVKFEGDGLLMGRKISYVWLCFVCASHCGRPLGPG